LTGESFAQQKVVFFDAIKWVPEDAATTNLQLDKIEFDRQSVASGELLKVKFTVTNIGEATLRSQEPQASRTPDGRFYNDGRDGRPDDAYVYDEGECFAGNNLGSYASYPKESNRFRVTLGPDDTSGIDCAAAFGKYPWRWGLNGDLAPGETRELVGYVRFRNYGVSNRTLKLRGNILQEYVKYFYDEAQGFSTATLTVRPEAFQPESASYDALLNPLARVYRLGDVPDNFLARTHNPLSIPKKDYLGSFAWNGAFIDWGSGGPVAGADDDFVIEQVRSFVAPTSGAYTFSVPSDDGAWLWVDGQLVVDNSGLHGADEITGTIALNAGVHTFAFKYFEHGGSAAAGYAVKIPGADTFTLLRDALAGGAAQVGSTFVEQPNIRIAAEDMGGSGVERVRWSWDGITWNDRPGALLELGTLQNGTYRLQFAAVDRAGNEGDMREVAFTVNTNLTVYRAYLPVAGR
ncbi:MAG TPA: PA14 domain-containing protein, partial [Roseiflexaceae bacterium]|nr:PA14 domain-containing protein [Roseiflexaceae bacterium]